MSKEKIYVKHINDLEKLLNRTSSCSPEEEKEIVKNVRALIKIIYKEMDVIKQENNEDLNNHLKSLIIRVRQILKGSVKMSCGYLIGILYHVHGYREIIPFVESYFHQKVDYDAFARDIDAGIFGYFFGLAKIKKGEYSQAITALEKAYLVCAEQKKEMLLMYLVPLKLRVGQYPDKLQMNKYGNKFLWELCNVVARGDINKYEKLVDENKIGLFETSLNELIQSLRLIVYRNFLVAYTQITKTRKFMFAQVVGVINKMCEEKYKINEMTLQNVCWKSDLFNECGDNVSSG